ncbi:DUF262 domain-containing protein [Mesorhizobium sp. BR-1-1-10]|uniref:DUF262 domain-containing protein n=1 Tax=Mesorhizobium sp. BR-1-1-10 TaxID=2876660 RepID=UPI001CD07E5A|nr:DUF262 domain-containing protein [Mesorhizobium sp. BR-1-1-10]MBZ9973933.1 DUF262 domain-containing protein [Mesorhizobium sp. BR-1-1-10]
MRESFITSYAHLFEARDGGTQIDQVEVPLIQRDYAQGRSDSTASQIRSSFVKSLHKAIVDDHPISLDFVYGDLDHGTLKPLDGQQRLTTLFLLHWYLASRTGRLSPDDSWTRFRYSTRPTAELFCELLGRHAFAGPDTVSQWLTDQAWYLHTWNHDPTVQSMLRMLDTIHAHFGGADFQQAWARLTDKARPAVSFHVLPLKSAAEGNALYIKMNSRGKPLTSFENFKARLEQITTSLPKADEFARKMDTAWSDLFWVYRGRDNLVDDEMLRYLEFVMEIALWRQGQFARDDAFELTVQLFGPANNTAAADNLDWLARSIDIWSDIDIAAYFGSQMRSNTSDATFGLPVFRDQVDLFEQCCNSYERREGGRRFGWPETLLLHAFIIHRSEKTTDFPRRLRMLRNLIEASPNELRLENMPGLIKDVETLVSEPDITNALRLTTFNTGQVGDENDKVAAIIREPAIEAALLRLEDHTLLRGSLIAFDLDVDAATFNARAAKFESCFSDKALWPTLTAALLSVGNYSRPKGARFYFGSAKDNATSWREVLTRGNREDAKRTRDILAILLDRLSQSTSEPKTLLEGVIADYLAAAPASDGYDWRWYLVKYPIMRDGNSGIYVGNDRELGYGLCMLDKTQLNSNYRDPFLSAIIKHAGAPEDSVRDRFNGYAHIPRLMVLTRSGTKIQCIPDGYQVVPPEDAAQNISYLAIAAKYGISNNLLSIPKMSANSPIDAVDRIVIGGKILGELIDAGL